MKKTMLKYSCAAVALTAMMSFAPEAKAEINPIKDNKLFYVTGNVEAGIYKNQYWNKDNASLLNNHKSDGQLNQAYIGVGKKIDTTKSFDVGGRVDYMFGTDAHWAQSNGFEARDDESKWGSSEYFSAIPQAYLELGNKDYTIKAGKFFGVMGGESLIASERFFYSLSNIYGITPATQTGVMGTYNLNDKMSVYGGWSNGENSTFDSSKNNAIFAGAKYALNSQTDLGLDVMGVKDRKYKPEEENVITKFSAGYKVNSSLEVKGAFAFLNQKFKHEGENRAYVYSGEAIYKLNDKLAVGGRAEYTHSYDNMDKDNMDAYSLTAALNYEPMEYVLIKPEVRYDRNGGERIFEHGTNGKKDQFSAGISAMVKF
ncbi:MAG: outer membrane beta-barrel protein [Alphaproteobacteria bacterium]